MTDFQLAGPEYIEEALTHRRGDRYILLEAHFSSSCHPRSETCTTDLHIPGAIQIHPSYLEAGHNHKKYYPCYDCPEDGNLLPTGELTAALELLGIDPDTEVIVYGSDPDGIMAAARLVWGLLYAGVKKVRLLDGGLAAWLAHGGRTTTQIRRAVDFPKPHQSAFFRWATQSQFLATTCEVRQAVYQTGKTRLVDVRSKGEYNGTRERHYTFYSKAGHIPTAVSQGNWQNLVDESQKLGPKLTHVRRRWRRLGILDADMESGNSSVVFYCGTGWRSSISFLVAHLLGLRAKNYDSGFYGWSWDCENEISIVQAGAVSYPAPAVIPAD